MKTIFVLNGKENYNQKYFYFKKESKVKIFRIKYNDLKSFLISMQVIEV